MSDIAIDATLSGNALAVYGGTVSIARSRIYASNAPTSGERSTLAGDAALFVDGGTVSISDQSVLGPGYSHSVAVTGQARLIVEGSSFIGFGIGVDAFGQAQLTLNADRFETPAAQWAIVVEDQVTFSVTNNRFTYATASTWFCSYPTATGSAGDNADNSGAYYPNRQVCA